MSVVQVEHGRLPVGAIKDTSVVEVAIATLHRKPRRAIHQPTVDWLVESFGEVGQLQAIVIDPEQNVLAGEHRIRAAEARGWKRLNAVVLTLDELRRKLVTLDENLVRNPGTELERSEQLRERKEIYEALHPETAHGGARDGAGRKSTRQDGDSKSPAAKTEPAPRARRFSKDTAGKTGQSERGVQRRVKIAEDLDPRAKKVIAKTPLADQITELEQLAKLEPAKQVEVAKRAVQDGTTVKRTVKDLRREEQVALIKKYVPPAGKYPVVVRDPAWPYRDQLEGDGARGGTPYPQASIEEICAQVPPMDEDCVVFLWCTNQHLIDLDAPVQRVMRAWGLAPKALVTWKKPRMGLGRYVRNITEQFVICTRGKPVLDLPDSTSWIEGDLGEHSEKPESFYGLVEQLCPARPIFEGDARERPVGRAGWVRSGAELPANALEIVGWYWLNGDKAAVHAIRGWMDETSLCGTATKGGLGPAKDGDPRCTTCERELGGAGSALRGAEPTVEARAGNEQPAHQWQRENPLSAPARALYRCLVCDAKHRGQEVIPPYGPCRSKELAPPPASRPTGWTWREVNIHPSVRRAHAMARPGEASTLCGAELSSGKPATPDRLPCEYCLAEIARSTGPYTLLATAAHRRGEDMCPGCGVTRKENSPEKGGVGWQHGSVGDRPALSQCQACVAKGVPRAPVGEEDQRAWQTARSRASARAAKATPGPRGAKKGTGITAREAHQLAVLPLAEFGRLAQGLGFSRTLKPAGKHRQAMCFACKTRILVRLSGGQAERPAVAELQRHQKACPAKRVREVNVQAGSYRDGRGGGQCCSLATRSAKNTRCKRAAKAVVKGAGRLWSVCPDHGHKAMSERVLRVALDGGAR